MPTHNVHPADLANVLRPDVQSYISIQNGYAVYGDSDQNEGRGPRDLICYTLDSLEAKRLAKGRGAMGSDGYVDEVTLLVIALADEHSRPGHNLTPRYMAPVSAFRDRLPGQTARDKALAKLSLEDREALGLR